MLELYDLHNEPEELLGYNRRFKVPGYAYYKILRLTKRNQRKKDPAIRKTIESLLPYIIKDPQYASLYANAMGEPWPEAEQYIIQDAKQAAQYAMFVMDMRWVEAEDLIEKNEEVWLKYQEWFRSEFI